MAKKQTHGQEIIEGLVELDIAAKIARLLAPVPKGLRDDVLALTAQVLKIADDRQKARPR